MFTAYTQSGTRSPHHSRSTAPPVRHISDVSARRGVLAHLVLNLVVVMVSIRQTSRGAESQEEEEGPRVGGNLCLLTRSTTEGAGFVVVANRVFNDNAGFTGDNACVGDTRAGTRL